MRRHILLEYSLLAFILLTVFAIYIVSIPPAFQSNDSPETAAAFTALDIQHPPGYPLVTMAGNIAVRLLPGSPAFSSGIFSSFLSVVVLLMAYLISLQLCGLCGTSGSRAIVLSLTAVAVLALSEIYMSQSIDAKGSIYMLNLLFISIIVCLCLSLLQRFNGFYLYLMFYVFGLSLSNHWPSMATVLPVLIIPVYIRRKDIKPGSYLKAGVFVLLGLTPYIYILIRSGNALMNWGYADNIEKLLWVVLRKGYEYPVNPGIELFLKQAGEIFKVIISGLSVFLLLALYGFCRLFKKTIAASLVPLSGAVLVMAAVTFINRSADTGFIFIGIFLMPAVLFIIVMVPAGAAGLYNRYGDKKAVLIMSAGIVIMFFNSINGITGNNHSDDYIAYDYAKNILKTFDEGVYIGEGDPNLFPVYYLRAAGLMKNGQDVYSAGFMKFKWGAELYNKKYKTDLEFINRKDFFNKAAAGILGHKHLFRSYFSPSTLKGLEIAFPQNYRGILLKVGKKAGLPSAWQFDIYSYRGIETRRYAESTMTSWYPSAMAGTASAFAEHGKYHKALALYKKLLLFPNPKPEGAIYGKMAAIYGTLGDRDRAYFYAQKAGMYR